MAEIRQFIFELYGEDDDDEDEENDGQNDQNNLDPRN